MMVSLGGQGCNNLARGRVDIAKTPPAVGGANNNMGRGNSRWEIWINFTGIEDVV